MHILGMRHIAKILNSVVALQLIYVIYLAAWPFAIDM